jgi:hypothetical protein
MGYLEINTMIDDVIIGGLVLDMCYLEINTVIDVVIIGVLVPRYVLLRNQHND